MGIAAERFDLRVWKTKEKKMIYGVTYINPLFDWNEEYILLQSTGKKDKNNKKIFDKDIVKVTCFIDDHFEHDIFIIEYDEEYLAWKLTPISGRKSEFFYEFKFHAEEFEVIGNIYENPIYST